LTIARERVALSDYTTLRLGGPACQFLEAADEAEAVAALAAADQRGEPVLVLGGGSNLVISDDGFPGTVLRLATRGVRSQAGDAGTVALTVAAGEDWDQVVAACVADGLAGLECLSGIPGRAGATPIQNVGAYGQEVAETIVSVRGYDRQRRQVTELPGTECGFGYRTSAFKRQAQAAATASGPGDGPGAAPGAATGRFVVLDVTFRLTRAALSQPVRYPELARVLGVAEGEQAPLADVRAAVLGLRRGKGMVLDPADPDTRSAGSFFVNPVLGKAELDALAAAAGGRVPCYPAGDGKAKVSAAWLIERAGFWRGYPGQPGGPPPDGPHISSKHTLALVNPGGATAASLTALAREVRDGVSRAFGVDLMPEPVLVGPGLALG
jgi:UDP-N-acetylmuramate dehydrogenase